jgi:hypothetical protein
VSAAARSGWVPCPVAPPSVGVLERDLASGGRTQCSAVVFDDRTILTAAHCFDGDARQERFFSTLDERPRAVASRCVDSRYAASCVGAYDLAVARLVGPPLESKKQELAFETVAGAVVSQRVRYSTQTGRSPLGNLYPDKVRIDIFDSEPTLAVFAATTSGGSATCFGVRVHSDEERFDLRTQQTFERLTIVVPSSTVGAGAHWSGSPVFVVATQEGVDEATVLAVVSDERMTPDGPLISALPVDGDWVRRAVCVLDERSGQGATAECNDAFETSRLLGVRRPHDVCHPR